MKSLIIPSMLTAAFVPALALGAQASGKPFDLEAQGSQVCKVGKFYAQPECLPNVYGSNQIPEIIDLVPRVRALSLAYPSGDTDGMSLEQANTFGGAIFITPNDRAKVLRYYRELSIRNIAIDKNHITQKDGFNLIPFVASVRWKGALHMEGTLQVEGMLKFSMTESAGQTGDESVNQTLKKWFVLNDYNDSSTELRKEPLRMIEKVSRFIHFTRVYGVKESLDQDTQALLLNVVAPAIAGEVVILPMAASLATSVSKALGQPPMK